MIRLIITDDHPVIRDGIKTVLANNKEIELAGCAADGAELMKLLETKKADVILMDINMPVMDGVRASRLITAQDQRVGIIILTMYREDEYVFEAIKAGAQGYVVKDARAREVLKAIRAVHRGEALIDPATATKLLEEFRRLAEEQRKELFDLNEQKIEILRLVAQGASNKEIAEALHFSEQTIKNKLSIIFQKLHVNNRAEAAASAIREGLISTDQCTTA